MKIAICITGLLKYVGGAERSVSELANELVKRGYDVVILNRELHHSADEKVFYPLHKGVKLATFYVGNEMVVKDHSDIIRMTKRRIVDISFRENIFVLKILIFRLFVNTEPVKRLIARMMKRSRKSDNQNLEDETQIIKWLHENQKEISLWRKNLLRQKPDVVISFMYHVYIMTDQVLQGHNIYHILANRNDPFKRYPNGNPFVRKLIDRAVENSTFNLIQLEAFRSYFLPEHHLKTIVIPNPVHLDSSMNVNYHQKRKMILSIGGYRSQKNHQLLIKAFFKICHKYPDWSVEIYGEELGLREKLYDLVNRLGLRKQVELKLPNQEIQKCYQEAAIFAMPSLYEGFSRALGEAMANELPCLVVEDCLSNAKMVREGECGLIAKNTFQDFAEKLESLILNDDKRKEFGEKGLRYIKQFSPEKIYDMWDNLLLGLSVAKAGSTIKENMLNIHNTL